MIGAEGDPLRVALQSIFGKQQAAKAFVLLTDEAPPSRSAAEARPPATEQADAVGSISDGLQDVPRELRPCCPDAGQERCHGQPFGACRCERCVRAERGLFTFIVNSLNDALKAAALPVASKRYVRRQLARLITQLRGRAQAAERLAFFAELELAAADERQRVAVAEAEKERDDALMQASAAAERGHGLREELERARAEVERLRGRAQRAEAYAHEAEQELKSLRELGSVAAPERTGRPVSDLDGLLDDDEEAAS